MDRTGKDNMGSTLQALELQLCLFVVVFLPLQKLNCQLQAYLNDKVKTAVRVPLERDGLERAKPLVSKIYTIQVNITYNGHFIQMTAGADKRKEVLHKFIKLLDKIKIHKKLKELQF